VTPSLEFQGISKRYGRQLALDRLTMDLRPGEILGFVGPNGAGKTTAIHLALGFVLPTSGGGRLLGAPFGDAVARARIGFVADAPAFFAGSAQQAVEFAGRLNGMRSLELRARAKELLARLDLKANGKDARHFSRGMQQRLGLVQALVNDPELLILDEPTSALDPPGVLEVRELLREARQAGKSVFFSSHQLTEVELICDRIAFLHKGQLLRYGTVEELTGASENVEIVVRGLPAESQLALSYSVKEQTTTGLTRLVVRAGDQRGAIEAAWTAGAELLSVNPVRRSLEELFVEWSAASDSASQPAAQSGDVGLAQ
jgi:ABC-2 type transport system ATP-binding protein